MLFVLIQLFSLTIIIRSGSTADLKLFSNPIMGPYKLVFKQVYNCNSNKHSGIQNNLYISHRDNTTFILGNTTSDIPLDDTLFLEMRMAIKDSSGSWKENAFMHKAPKACSTLKSLIGNGWPSFIHGIGAKSTECPILPGIYIGPGLDTSIFTKSNFPKALIYGTYKFHMYYSKANEIFGCQVYILEIKRV